MCVSQNQVKNLSNEPSLIAAGVSRRTNSRFIFAPWVDPHLYIWSPMSEPPISHTARQALSRLLDAQGDRLYATLARLTLRTEAATELFQELFLRLGRNPAFAKANDPTAYAFRSAINLAMEWRRKRRIEITTAPLLSATEIVSAEPSPLQRMIQSEQHEQLLNALSELGESDQRLFVLRFIEQQSYELIAKEFETTPHRARGLCHAAVRRLRQKMSARVLPNDPACQEKNHV
jgi:RNA polymerase sigma-70 factor (ECF subfamily)